MMFGRSKVQNKVDAFKTTAGQWNSSFRRKAIKNTILHIQKKIVPPEVMKIPLDDICNRPEYSWFRKIVPSASYCEEVSKYNEVKGATARRRKFHLQLGQGKRKPNDFEIAEFALNQAYSCVVRAMNDNRRTCKKMFFGRVGYIVTDWKSISFNDVEQNIAAMWVNPVTGNEYTRPCNLPDAQVATKEGDVDKENAKLFERVVRERQEMALLLNHEVIVCSRKPKSKSNPNGKLVTRNVRPFSRTVSLMTVALSMLVELCGIPNRDGNHTVLKYHSKSIAACYAIAICLKQLLKAYPEVTAITDLGEQEEDESQLQCDESQLQYSSQLDNSMHEQMNGRRSEENWSVNFNTHVDRTLLDIMRFGEKYEREVLSRQVGNVQETFWKRNHMPDDGEENGDAEERSERSGGVEEGHVETPVQDEEVEVDM